jgi:hypothetical protein
MYLCSTKAKDAPRGNVFACKYEKEYMTFYFISIGDIDTDPKLHPYQIWNISSTDDSW